MTKEPVEDVFLTHLEMEFPEFKHIAASVKGKLMLWCIFSKYYLLCCNCEQSSLTTYLQSTRRQTQEELGGGLRRCRLNELQEGKLLLSSFFFKACFLTMEHYQY